MRDPLADELDLQVIVQGARGAFERDALIKALAEAVEDREAAVQAFDPAAVYGPEHLRAAARRAWRAHEDDRPIAREIGVEVACYAAGVDQIDAALDAVGVPSTGDVLVLCALGEDAHAALDAAIERAGLEPDEAVLGRPASALERLGLEADNEDEEDAWGRVLEHVALLDARR